MAMSTTYRRPGWLGLVVLFALAVSPQWCRATGVIVFGPPEPGDRRVVLRWNAAEGDTFARIPVSTTGGRTTRVTERQLCREICESCCGDRLFGGYQIWRSLPTRPGQFELLRTYSVLDSTWTFNGTERQFVDPDSVSVRGCTGNPDLGVDNCDPLTGRAIAPFNGFFYRYAITWFESRVDTVGGQGRIVEFPMQTIDQGAWPDPVEPGGPAITAAPILGRVQVVPNPFDPSDKYGKASFGDEQRIQFIHLPSPATVKIFTIAGDLVRELENNDNDGVADWNLKNADGEEVVGGIYLFVAEVQGGDQVRRGHFVIIR